MADRVWAEYNSKGIATMPFCGYIFGEELPGDVGVNDIHEDDDLDMVQGMIKVQRLVPKSEPGTNDRPIYAPLCPTKKLLPQVSTGKTGTVSSNGCTLTKFIQFPI